jgi:hypothetical protein
MKKESRTEIAALSSVVQDDETACGRQQGQGGKSPTSAFAKVLGGDDPMKAIDKDLKQIQARHRAHVRATISRACEAELDALETERFSDRRVEGQPFMLLFPSGS